MKTAQMPLMIESRRNRDISYIQTQEDTIELARSQQIIYDHIKTHTSKGGITDQEIAIISGMPLSSVNARRNELINIGLVTDNGSISYYDDNGHQRYRTLWRTVEENI